MGKKVNVASFGLNEAFWRGKTQEEMMDVILDKIESVRGYKPDLICLPEIFLKTGGDKDNPNWAQNSARMVQLLREKAREMSCYIMASVYEPYEEGSIYRYNTSILLNRQGETAGKYRKVHTVVEETNINHVLPAQDVPVFDTDFGRVGMQICFDIGWREGWQKLADQGAQLVIWSSAYDGGNLLNTYAAYHMYFVVSSVRTDHARIIDPTGRVVAEGARWNGLAMATIDLETTLFHIDRQYKKIDTLRRDLGDKVTIRVFSEENVFTIESNDPQWPISRICSEYGLMTYKEYHAEATANQKKWLAGGSTG